MSGIKLRWALALYIIVTVKHDRIPVWKTDQQFKDMAPHRSKTVILGKQKAPGWMSPERRPKGSEFIRLFFTLLLFFSELIAWRFCICHELLQEKTTHFFENGQE